MSHHSRSQQSRSGLSWRATVGLTVIAMIAALLAGPPQRAQAALGEGPAPLLSQSILGQAGGTYAATDKQQVALRNLEKKAVQNTLTDHQLPAGDADAAQTWGRFDTVAELWALLAQAIRTEPAERSADQQLAVDWLTAVQHRQDLAAAQNAGLEYAKWAGLGAARYRDLLATNPSYDQLVAFLSGNPLNFGRGMSPGTRPSEDNEGYCVYVAPKPVSGQYTSNIYTPGGQSTAPMQCYIPCQSTAGCAAPTPSFDQFVQWGLAKANQPFTELSWERSNVATVRALGFVGSAAGAGIIGVATSSALAATGALEGSAIFAAIQPYLARALVTTSGQLVAGALSGKAVAEMAGVIAASEVGFLVGIVIAGIAAAVQIGIKLDTDARLPGQLAQLATDARGSTPDLRAVLKNPTATTGLFSLFVGATLPDPLFDTCSNLVVGAGKKPCLNAPPVPARAAGDPVFVVTAEGAATSTTTDSLSFANTMDQTTNTVRVSGHWFVHQATAKSDGSSLTRATLQLRYTDWGGTDQVVWLVGDLTSGYRFLRASFGGSIPLDPATCGSNSTCGASPVIQFVGTDGKHYSATLAAGAPPQPVGLPTTTSVKAAPAAPQRGRPVTFTAIVRGDSRLLFDKGSMSFVATAEDGTRTTLCANVRPTQEQVPIDDDDVTLPPEVIRTLTIGGRATCTATFAGTGNRTVTVTYDGSAAGAQTSTGTTSFNVGTVAPTTTRVTASPFTTSLDATGSVTITYTATVAPFYSADTTTPGGIASFPGQPGCASVPLAGTGRTRTADCAVSYTDAGSKVGTAVYSGDAKTGGSTGAAKVSVGTGPVTIRATMPATVSPGDRFDVAVTLTSAAGTELNQWFNLVADHGILDGSTCQPNPGAPPVRYVRGMAPASCSVRAGDSEGPITVTVYTDVASVTKTVTVVKPVTVRVAGGQEYGRTPQLRLDGEQSEVALSGVLACTKVNGGGEINRLDSPLELGKYTIDGSSCSGLTAANGARIDYVGVSDGFSVGKATQTVSFEPVVRPLAGTSAKVDKALRGGGSDSPLVFSVNPASGPDVCTITPLGQATFLKAGQCLIDLNQDGDAHYEAAPTFTQTISVLGAPSGINISSLEYRAYAGEPFTIKASIVAPSGVQPSGTVTFADSNSPKTPFCTEQLPSKAPFEATCTITFTTPGLIYLTIVYSGDDHLASSWVAPAIDVVVRSTTTVTTSDPRPAPGASTRFTATVEGSARVDPVGQVLFADENGNGLCGLKTLPEHAPYQVTCDYAFADPGPHTVTATYDGGERLYYSEGSVDVMVEAPVVLQSLRIDPDAASVPAGKTVNFTATGHYSDGTDKAVGVAWTLDKTTIASIDPESGVAVGIAPGKATVTATSGSVSASAELTVTAAVLTDLSIAPKTLSLAKGSSGALVATGRYSDGGSRDLTATAEWSTSAASVAEVSAGAVTAHDQGRATITATIDGASATAEVTVTAAVPTALAIDPGAPRLAAGSTLQLAATARYTDGSTAVVTDGVQWKVAEPAIASLADDAPGLLTGRKTGSTTVTASLGELKATVTATVTAAELRSIVVSPAKPKAALGTTVTFTATGSFSDGNKQDLTGQVKWSSSNARIASIDTHGVATAKARGTATIAAASGTIRGTATLTVAPPVLTGLALRPDRLSLAKGLHATVTVIGSFSDGSARPLDGTKLTSSKSSVVTASGRRLTAKAIGTATVTARVGTLTATMTVKVTAPVVRALQITPTRSSVRTGKTVTLRATGVRTDGSKVTLTAGVAWHSSSTATASVKRGKVTGKKPGLVAITVRLGDLTAVAVVRVTR